MRLRGTVDSTITQCANDMWSSWNTSNTALQQRVAETTTAHNNLQSHLARTNQEIYDQQKHISQLQRAIRDKEAPLMVCSIALQLIGNQISVTNFMKKNSNLILFVSLKGFTNQARS